MPWLHTLASLAALVAVVTGVLSPDERFSKYQALQRSSAPIKLDEQGYRELTSAQRNFTAAIVLTALDPRWTCGMCTQLAPEWNLLARSWTKGDPNGDSGVIFATLDFADGRDIFSSLSLQSAPVLMLFPPTTGPYAAKSPKPQHHDFSTGVWTAEQVQAWIARHTPDRPHPPIKRPINWVVWASSTTIVLGIVTGAVSAAPYLSPIIQNRNLWAAISLIAILVFLSGHMFNQIRRTPYLTLDKKGGIVYFADGYSNQFGLETQIVAAMYGTLALCTISLALKVPRMANPKTQKVAVVVWGATLFLVNSFLMRVFRYKNGGYPFFLPPFM